MATATKTTMRVGAAIKKYRISRKPSRDTIAPLKEDNETYLKKVWHPKRASYVMVDENTGDMHEIPKPPKNILDEILEDYWESVCDFVEPAPCHKAESVPLREWSFDLKENNRLLAVEGIGHLDQYGTHCAGYVAPLGCRLRWVCEMR